MELEIHEYCYEASRQSYIEEDGATSNHQRELSIEDLLEHKALPKSLTNEVCIDAYM